jgi:tellurite resistance protein TehA-like permease
MAIRLKRVSLFLMVLGFAVLLVHAYNLSQPYGVAPWATPVMFGLAIALFVIGLILNVK